MRVQLIQDSLKSRLLELFGASQFSFLSLVIGPYRRKDLLWLLCFALGFRFDISL